MGNLLCPTGKNDVVRTTTPNRLTSNRSGGGPTQSLRDGDSRAVSRNDAEDEECKNRTESNASVKDEKSSEAHAAKVIKQFSEYVFFVVYIIQYIM